MKMYELRSDTFTKPSPEMRRAMYEAEVGDDVFGEDPTVNRLQDMAADLTGKERSLFVTSGIMGNLISLFLSCGRGREFLVEEKGHILTYELGSYSVVAGCIPVPVAGERGILDAGLLKAKLRPQIYYLSQPSLVVLENTHNFAGGTCYPLANLVDIYRFAEERSLRVHMDGARIFNAAAATGTALSEICRYADTVTFCLSKGLGAPVGSLLCGSKAFIEEARIVRRILGGGMRQAGILAAAGIYALSHNIARIGEDHENARELAESLARTPWAEVDPMQLETNIVIFDTPHLDASRVVSRLKDSGILAIATGSHQIRMVTHLEISREDTKRICDLIGKLEAKAFPQ